MSEAPPRPAGADLPPPKSPAGPPKWMFFAGCGCLVPGFLLVSAGAYFLQQMGGMMNQQRAWDDLEQLIGFDDALRGTPTGVLDNPKTPIDESLAPAEFEMKMGGRMPISEGGQEFYYLGRDVATPMEDPFVTGPDPLLVTIAKLPADQSESATSAPAGTPAHEDATLEVKGRTLRVRKIPRLVTPARRVPFLFEVPERSGAGAAVWLRDDFEVEGDEGLFDLVVFFQRPGSMAPITSDEIRGFLEPFDLTLPAEDAEGAELETPRDAADEGDAKEDEE